MDADLIWGPVFYSRETANLDEIGVSSLKYSKVSLLLSLVNPLVRLTYLVRSQNQGILHWDE